MTAKLKYWIILFCVCFFACTENKNDEEKILKKIALTYINVNEDEIINIERYRKENGFRKTPVVVNVTQFSNYRGYKIYSVWYSVGVDFSLCTIEKFKEEELLREKTQTSIVWEEKTMPSKLIKAKGRYIAMYLNDSPSKNRENIPSYLFLYDTGDHSADIGSVLMCEKCNNFIAIGIARDGSHMYSVPIVQIEEFTCDCSVKIRPRNLKIKVEDAIQDITKEYVIKDWE